MLQVCIALSILAGDNFHRMGALAGGIERSTATRILNRVVTAINAELKDEFVRFPTSDELRELADENLEKYHLPGKKIGHTNKYYMWPFS